MKRIIKPDSFIDSRSDAYWRDVEARRMFAHPPGPIRSLQFAPGGKLLSSSHFSNELLVWDWQTGQRQSSFVHGDAVVGFAVTPDGAEVVSDDSEEESRWSIATGELTERRRVASALYGGAMALAFDAEGRRLARANFSDLCSWGTSVTVCRVDDDVQDDAVGHWSQPFVLSLDFSPDGRWLASGWEYGYLRIWDLNNPRVQPREYRCQMNAPPNRHGQVLPAAVSCVRYSPRGDLLAMACGPVVFFRGMENRRVFARLTGHQHDVNSIAFTPSGEKLLSAAADGLVKIWSVAARRCDLTIDWEIGAVSHVAVSPDGRMAAAGGELDKIVLWEL
jgi:WD40 repeat protein